MGWGVEHVGLGPQPMDEHPNESMPNADRRVEPCGHRDTKKALAPPLRHPATSYPGPSGL